jgi:hypothetical protein
MIRNWCSHQIRATNDIELALAFSTVPASSYIACSCETAKPSARQERTTTHDAIVAEHLSDTRTFADSSESPESLRDVWLPNSLGCSGVLLEQEKRGNGCVIGRLLPKDVLIGRSKGLVQVQQDHAL